MNLLKVEVELPKRDRPSRVRSGRAMEIADMLYHEQMEKEEDERK